jgi:hypothetical protein
MKTINTNKGELLVGQPNEFLSQNPQPGYTPGETFFIINGKLELPISSAGSPYHTQVTLEVVSERYALCCIRGNSWYIFPVRMNAEGARIIETSVYRKFDELKQEHEHQLEEQKRQAANASETQRIAENRANRRAIATTLRDNAFGELRFMLGNKELNELLTDSEISEAVNRYYTYDLILHAL